MVLALVIFAVLVALAKSAGITKCTYDESICGCKTDDGYISLRKYADKAFQDTDSVSGFTYYWSPCKDITKGSITSSCVQEDAKGNQFDCGTHKSYTTEVKDGDAVFHMVAADNQRNSEISCICSEGASDTFIFDGEDPFVAGVYDMSLKGDSCCSKTGSLPGTGSGGLSVGSILLIIVLVVVIVYLLAGVVVQSAVRKAEGRERIPNVSFWSLLPGLVRDGFRFTFSCGKASQYNEV